MSGKILRVKAIHAKKLGRLGYSAIEELAPDKVLFNFSSRVLTDAEKSLLGKGLKFALPPRKLTLEHHLYTFEKLFESLQHHTINDRVSENGESFKDKLRHLAKSAFSKFQKSRPTAVLSDEESKALISLSKDKSIVICRPDKGNGVVLMDKSNYQSRINLILEDTSKFQKLDSDTNSLKLVFSLEDKIRTFLKKTFDSVDSRGKRGPVYDFLYPTGTNLGVLYGLPKVHKNNYPIRPILSACNTPNYNLAKYLVPNLSPLTKNCYTVHSSFTFAKEICGIKDTTLHMASFDVTSLFTNIPLQETTDIIISEIFDNPEYSELVETCEFGIDNYEKFFKCHTPGRVDEISYLSKSQLRKLIELATLDNYFFFNGDIYKQVDGVAMGSPLGPTLANLFMNYMEKKWLEECPLDFKPVLYRRYVDDTFLLFKSRNHVELFRSYLNSRHPNISFTCDLEENDILPFLDVKVQRSDAQFITSIYRKPTFTGLFSKFYAFSPLKNKENLIATLTVRAYRICSNYDLFNQEIDKLKSILQSNGYPLKFIERVIGKMLCKLYKPDGYQEVLNYDVPRAQVYFSTFYLGDISKQIAMDLKKIVSESYPQIQLLITYKTHSAIGSRFGFKDKQPKLNQSNLIYRYTCECCKAFYIGKTERQLGMRISEHMGVSVRTGNALKVPPHSDISDHCKKCHTSVCPDNFSIEDSHLSNNGLLILESLYQQTKKPAIGIMQQSTPLMSFN